MASVVDASNHDTLRHRARGGQKDTSVVNNGKGGSIEVPLAPPSSVRSSEREPLVRLVNIDRNGLVDDQEDEEDEDDVDRSESEEEPEAIAVEEPDPIELWWDEFFDSLLYTVPCCFLYLMLDILTNLSYSRHPEISYYAKNLCTAVPTIGIIVFYSSRHATSEITRTSLILASIFSGCRLIWLVNKAPYLTVMEQGPAVGTLWILTIVQLPLDRAVLALIAVAVWGWWKKMKLTP